MFLTSNISEIFYPGMFNSIGNCYHRIHKTAQIKFLASSETRNFSRFVKTFFSETFFLLSLFAILLEQTVWLNYFLHLKFNIFCMSDSKFWFQ